MKQSKKLFIVHNREDIGCCEADGGEHYVSKVYGIFSSLKRAEEFKKQNRRSFYIKYADITEKVLDSHD